MGVNMNFNKDSNIILNVTLNDSSCGIHKNPNVALTWLFVDIHDNRRFPEIPGFSEIWDLPLSLFFFRFFFVFLLTPSINFVCFLNRSAELTWFLNAFPAYHALLDQQENINFQKRKKNEIFVIARGKITGWINLKHVKVSTIVFVYELVGREK